MLPCCPVRFNMVITTGNLTVLPSARIEVVTASVLYNVTVVTLGVSAGRRLLSTGSSRRLPTVGTVRALQITVTGTSRSLSHSHHAHFAH